MKLSSHFPCGWSLSTPSVTPTSRASASLSRFRGDNRLGVVAREPIHAVDEHTTARTLLGALDQRLQATLDHRSRAGHVILLDNLADFDAVVLGPTLNLVALNARCAVRLPFTIPDPGDSDVRIHDWHC